MTEIFIFVNVILWFTACTLQLDIKLEF